MKRTRIRPRSDEMAAKYRVRALMREELLDERGDMCQRCKARPWTDMHEVLRRSAGGDITDKAGIRCLCRECHDWVGANPREAIQTGWAISRFRGG